MRFSILLTLIVAAITTAATLPAADEMSLFVRCCEDGRDYCCDKA
jgi:hypothetical protein